MVRVEIQKTDSYDLVGRVVEIEPRPSLRRQTAPVPAEALTRITTGAPLRVIG